MASDRLTLAQLQAIADYAERRLTWLGFPVREMILAPDLHWGTVCGIAVHLVNSSRNAVSFSNWDERPVTEIAEQVAALFCSWAFRNAIARLSPWPADPRAPQ